MKLLKRSLAGFLLICMLCAVCGCNSSAKPSKGSSSSKHTPSANNSSDSSDISSDLSSDISDDSMDFSDIEDSSSDDDIPDDFTFVDSRILKIDNTKPVTTNFSGLAGIYHSYLFMPDNTLDEPYTDEELNLEMSRVLQMGASLVRTRYYPSWSWNGAENKWDWDSDCMQAFYKYADIMKKNGIDICISYWNGASDTTDAKDDEGRENPFPVLAGNSNFDDCIKYAGQWAADFVKEVVIKRGYDNVKYLTLTTEPDLYGCYGIKDPGSFENFQYWLKVAKTFHEVLVANGVRDKIKLVGPQSVYNGALSPTIDTNARSFTWLKWAIQYANDYVDIYSSHRYVFSNAMSDDYYAYWYNFTDECMKLIKPTGKPYWGDEFNMLEYGNYKTSAADPVHGTQVMLAQIGQMNAGMSSAILWQLTDQKWPGITTTGYPSWEMGVHVIGLNTYFRNSTIPRAAYYVYSMVGRGIRKGSTIYPATCVENGVYATMIENPDGQISFVVVSTAFNSVDIKLELSKTIGGKTLNRYEYSPFDFKPTTLARPITSKSVIKNVSDTFSDTIPPYAVMLYTTYPNK